MTDPIPVNLSAIEARQAQQQSGKMIAQQLMSSERFQEEVEVGFNPGAVEREQSRLNKFRPLSNRALFIPKQEKKIQEVQKKTDEDTARQFNQQNRELPEDRLLALKRALKNGSTPEQILEDVERQFPDPTLTDEALSFLEQTSDTDMREAIQQARMIHQNLKQREITAGRNINPAAQQFFNKRLGASQTELRNLYRDVIGEQKEHNVLFSELSSKYPFNQLKNVINFLLKSLGYDLKSKGPSIERGELTRLMTETRNLQSILWIYLFFKSRMKLVLSQSSKLGASIPQTLNFEKIAKEFIKLVEDRYPTMLKIIKQLDEFGLKQLIAKIIILSQFRDALRQLSPRLYKSLKHRQDLLLVIIEALEELEDQEEERREKQEFEEEEKEKKKQANKKTSKESPDKKSK